LAESVRLETVPPTSIGSATVLKNCGAWCRACKSQKGKKTNRKKLAGSVIKDSEQINETTKTSLQFPLSKHGAPLNDTTTKKTPQATSVVGMMLGGVVSL
jgi:hypothetical protein